MAASANDCNWELLCQPVNRLGDLLGPYFSINAAPESSIASLKRIIHEQVHDVASHVPPRQLELWKPSENMDIDTFESAVAEIQFPGSDVKNGVVGNLVPLKTHAELSTYWKRKPEKTCLHIIVLVPLASKSTSYSHKSGVSSSSSRSSGRSSNATPHLRPHQSWREKTVESLYNILQHEYLVMVRGTPGSGKTTLKDLLHHYIREKHPNDRIFTFHRWSAPPPTENGSIGVQERFFQLTASDPPIQTWLLFDDAQATYSDDGLWDVFLKNIHGSSIKAILFCSYERPNNYPVEYQGGSLPLIHLNYRIGLRPRINRPGLLFSGEEFDEAAQRHKYLPSLAPALRDYLFMWTAGHPGITEAVFDIIGNQCTNEFPVLMHLHDFFSHFTLKNLSTTVSQSARCTRGLPFRTDFITYATQFQALLFSGARFPPNSLPVELVEMHRRGWIHSETYMGDGFPHVEYTLPSPFHHTYLSLFLLVTTASPHHENLLSFGIDVLKNLNMKQLSSEHHRAGTDSTGPPLEAQYQKEFYHAAQRVVEGALVICPEFASERGAFKQGFIDFFIPSRGWGIELLRNSNGIPEHGQRFDDQGAYGHWLGWEVLESLIIDCRWNEPKKKYPEFPNLIHAVFHEGTNAIGGGSVSESSATLTIYSNMLEILDFAHLPV